MKAVPDLTSDNAKTWGWKVVRLATGAAAGVAAERVVAAIWSVAGPGSPPTDDGDRHTPWGQAVVWGAAVGLGAGVARVLAHRSAAVAWEAATNEPPPLS